MARPRKPSRAEILARLEIDKLKTALVLLRTELTGKEGYVGRLEYLLSLRTARIDHLTSMIDKLRDQNKRLDQEAERLAEMVKLSPLAT